MIVLRGLRAGPLPSQNINRTWVRDVDCKLTFCFQLGMNKAPLNINCR